MSIYTAMSGIAVTLLIYVKEIMYRYKVIRAWLVILTKCQIYVNGSSCKLSSIYELFLKKPNKHVVGITRATLVSQPLKLSSTKLLGVCLTKLQIELRLGTPIQPKLLLCLMYIHIINNYQLVIIEKITTVLNL